jgi:phenylalanyl-tRNA synthetase beta chain
MKVSTKWLKDYITLKQSPEEMAELLTMSGNEVAKVITTGGWDNVVIGELRAGAPHPNADRIRLATVWDGAAEHTVVCGAPNLTVGDKIAFASVGAHLIDGHTGEPMRLKASKIRGVLSEGMCCSEKELGLSQQHEGILILPKDAPVGMKLADYMGDSVIDLEVTPNRPDCLSVIGIARELHALTKEPLSALGGSDIAYPESGTPVESQIKITIADPDLCPRYSATLITGIKLGESPRWMQERLTAAGMRPINNIVDITNYVMMEWGQPLHAFDYDKLAGREIIVRRAKDGEQIKTLDRVFRTLSHDTLVIADRDKAVAIAGVMGGEETEVTAETKNILIESASFRPSSVHYTAAKLGLHSEASQRFERGVSRELTMPAVKRATQLVAEIAGGSPAMGVLDVYPGKRTPEPIRLTVGKAEAVLGEKLTLNEIVETLDLLGFEVKADAAKNEVEAIAPYWRSDIRIPEDLIEEVARITGYDKITPAMLCEALPKQNPEPAFRLKRGMKNTLTGYGLQEIVTYALTSEPLLKKVYPESNTVNPAPLYIMNPMTEEQTCLRTNLRAGLMAALAANRRFEEGGINLFELGKVYLRNDVNLPDEPDMLTGVLAGARFEKAWNTSSDIIDFYDAKGIVEGVLASLGIRPSFVESNDETFAAKKQAAVLVEGNPVGVLGEVHPKVLAAFELAEPTYLFELNVTALLPYSAAPVIYKPVPRFPAVPRDIALVLDYGVPHEKVQDVITHFPLVAQVKLFDVYSGKQVPEGKKSLAYSIVFMSPDHTLTDDDVNGVMEKIVARLNKEFGATLRT